jgi:hypothetical protein
VNFGEFYFPGNSVNKGKKTKEGPELNSCPGPVGVAL